MMVMILLDYHYHLMKISNLSFEKINVFG